MSKVYVIYNGPNPKLNFGRKNKVFGLRSSAMLEVERLYSKSGVKFSWHKSDDPSEDNMYFTTPGDLMKSVRAVDIV